MCRNVRGFVSKIARYVKLNLLPYAAPVVDTVVISLIKDSVICLDDFERRGTELSAKDVLGLVNYLKEKRGCRIAILAADQGDDDDVYESFKEKVLDEYIRFDPSSEVACSIVFGTRGGLSDLLKEFSLALNIKNVRLLKRINESGIQFWKIVANKSVATQRQVLRDVVLFHHLHFSQDRSFPQFDTVSASDFSLYKYFREPVERAAWVETFESIGYTHTDNLDRAIAASVKSGFLRQEVLGVIVRELDSILHSRQLMENFHGCFAWLHSSLNHNENEVYPKLNDAARAALPHLRPGDLSEVVTIFRAMGKDTEAKSLVDAYWLQNDDLDDRNPLSYADQVDKYIVESFKALVRPEVVEPKHDFLLRLASQWPSLEESDVRRLIGFDEKDWVSIFSRFAGGELRKIIEISKSVGPEVAEPAKKALLKIASKDGLHKLLVSKYIQF